MLTMELCDDWKAWHDRMPGKPPVLHVTGKCCSPTGGWSVALQRHEPHGINPGVLILDLVVTEGPVGTDAPAELDVDWKEETDFGYEQVVVRPVSVVAEERIIDVEVVC